MSKKGAEQSLGDLRSELGRIRDAVDRIDKTPFGELEGVFDQMARDLSDAERWLKDAETEVDEISESEE